MRLSFVRRHQLFSSIILLGALFVLVILVITWNTSSPGHSSSLNDPRLHQVSKELMKELKELSNRVRLLEEETPKYVPHGANPLPYDKVYPSVKKLAESDRKRILVTGGSGFVGSHLVDQLMMDGHEVYAVDNFFTGRKKNIEHWLGHENFELITHDIVKPLMLEVDQIYHLASPASPVKYMYNPIKTLKTNTVGTLNMLGLAKRVRARILFASTSEVYGDPDVHPQKESYWGHVNPIGPRACYDEGKRVSETMMYAYQKQDNIEVRVARIFNTYGPRMHMYDGRVVSNFIIQALQGKSLTVYSPGTQTRSFMYVSDLVKGLIALMNGNYSLPVNLGNTEEHTISEFAHIILDLLGGGEVEMKPHNQDDPKRRKPDITLAKQYLKWSPVVPLRTGLRKTIDYFKHEIGNTTRNSIR